MGRFLVQHYLETTATARPEAVAVVDGNRSVSYRVLDEQSNKVARQLRMNGLREGATVGVYLPKSVEAVIAFHAILKAGGVYVPLDTQYSPVERIWRILDISETVWLITNETGWSTLAVTTDYPAGGLRNEMKIILLDSVDDTGSAGTLAVTMRLKINNSQHDEWLRIPDDISAGIYAGNGESVPKITANLTENDLAYILYTSGSTGDPKGVMITHRNAMTFIDWAVSEFKPQPGMSFSNHAPFHFDLSVFDLYVAFATGGTVHLVPHTIMNNPRALVDWIDDHCIVFWYSVPSVWIALLNYARIDARKFEHLRVILFAGEVFPPKFLKGLMLALPGRFYYNLYGPTETNVCTYHQVKTIDEIGIEPVPIGKSCENTVVVALDEQLQEVATGTTGELYVRGPGVAAGYYRDPKKTAESFRMVAVGNRGGQIMYATGDIVRKLTEETYLYVGRKDLMVKCAGFRVELQEIEKVIDRHDAVRETVVVPCYHEKRGSIALHAYIAIKPGKKLTIMELKKYCGDALPRYMVPEGVHVLDELPRNQNGKVDRQLLQKKCDEIPERKG